MVSMHFLCYTAKLSQDLNSIKSCHADSYVRWLRHVTVSETEKDSEKDMKTVPETLVYVSHLMWLSVKAGNTFLITPVRQASYILICTRSELV
jgi:hypothetical protein